ncbi:MAG: hypothetical protein HY619_01465 [Thaumarchaeota archaeon]|nr:hypothetical protein [Nitrososphaerota archaeon]
MDTLTISSVESILAAKVDPGIHIVEEYRFDALQSDCNRLDWRLKDLFAAFITLTFEVCMMLLVLNQVR